MIKIIGAFCAVAISTGAVAQQEQIVDWQSTRWHMTLEQVAAISSAIAPTTAAERRDHTNPDIGVALLKSRYVAEQIEYTAYYWFRDDKLVSVALKPQDFRHWPRVSYSLEQIYGKPSEDNSQKLSATTGCSGRDRIWISERDKMIVKFFALECNRHRHLNSYTIRYEPVLTRDKAGP